jgi:hypothetical protein
MKLIKYNQTKISDEKALTGLVNSQIEYEVKGPRANWITTVRSLPRTCGIKSCRSSGGPTRNTRANARCASTST